MKKVISKIINILSEKILLNQKENILCAVSGGQDSVFLFFLLLHLQKHWNLKIKVVCFNHFWQNKNFSSMHQVWKLLFVFKNPLYLVFSETFLDNEQKAREWRQFALTRISNIESCKKIFTGHTGSDQIETAFWHLIRGASPQGFGSLKYKTSLLSKNYLFKNPKFLDSDILKFQLLKMKNSEKNLFIYKNLKQKTGSVLHSLNLNFIYKKIKNKKSTENLVSFTVFKTKAKLGLRFFYNNLIFLIQEQNNNLYSFLFFDWIIFNKSMVRPLLIFHRKDITFFCKLYLLPTMYDPTNKELYWSRNRIRNQLFPLVRFFFNPQTEYVLTNFLEINCEEQKYLESNNEKIIQYWLNNYYQNLVSKQICFQRKETSKNKLVYKKFHLLFKNNRNLLLPKIKNSRYSSVIYSQFQSFPKAVQRILLKKIVQSHTNFKIHSLQIELIRKKQEKN